MEHGTEVQKAESNPLSPSIAECQQEVPLEGGIASALRPGVLEQLVHALEGHGEDAGCQKMTRRQYGLADLFQIAEFYHLPLLSREPCGLGCDVQHPAERVEMRLEVFKEGLLGDPCQAEP